MKGIKIISNFIIKLCILLAVIYLLAYAGKNAYDFVYGFFVGGKISTEGEDIELVVSEGTSSQEVAKLLKEKGVIENELLFNIRVRLSEFNGKFRYGTFQLNTGMSEDEVMKILSTEGDRKETRRFTIPEGYSIKQIAKKLEDEKFCTAEEFIKAVNEGSYDYKFLEGIPEDREFKLQGYLFPDTYEVYSDATATDIVKIMLRTFDKNFVAEYYERAEALGYTVDEIVNIAAMVEREAKIDEDRAAIAGVIYNRLGIDMLLQIDATVQYVKTEGMYGATRILYVDLEIDSPYNTYKYKGLPTGPISNPGRKSIAATLYPGEHEFFYYRVSDEETGAHRFSKTLEEHNGN